MDIDELEQLYHEIGDNRNKVLELEKLIPRFRAVCHEHCEISGLDFDEDYGNAFHILRATFLKGKPKKAYDVMHSNLGLIIMRSNERKNQGS